MEAELMNQTPDPSPAKPPQEELPAAIEENGENLPSFDELIQGRYKEEYQKRTQRIIDSRFRESRRLEKQQQAVRPVLDMLFKRYGVDPAGEDAPQRLMQALSGGAPQQSNAPDELENGDAASKQEASGRMLLDHWLRQGQETAAIYPDFDLKKEIRSESGQRFSRLLKSGVDVKTAYEVIHKDELLSGAIRYAVKKTQQRTLEEIRSRGLRPEESGAGSLRTPARLQKPDPSTWSDAEMEDVLRRVRRGERVEL